MVKRKRVKPASLESADLNETRLEALKELFPESFSEGKMDFGKLREALGDLADDRAERYSFSWAGKRDAIRLLQAPSRATLRPARKESIDFDSTKHLFIEGDNLEVLKLLYKAYAGRVKMIYIDPPYNTGKDFIYPDNFADPLDTYLRLTGQTDEAGNLMTSNPETSGRYHSAWLSMMYPRLFIARQLLREDGVIFVSIDDHEVHNLRMLMNEIFGEENFVAEVIWQKVFAPKNTARHFSDDHDYIVLYARNAEAWTPTLLPRGETAKARYDNTDNDPRGPWASSDLTARNYYSEGIYEVTSPSGKKFKPTKGTYFRVNKMKFEALNDDNRIWWGENQGNMPRLKRFLSEVKEGVIPQTLWLHKEVGNTQEAKKELLANVPFEETENILNTVKPTRLLKRITQITTNDADEDIVLDFFAGSASTAHAVLNINRETSGNRRFVCVQIPEPLKKEEKAVRTIADMGKERIRHVIAKMKKDSDDNPSLLPRENPEDLGFRVFKLGESHFKRWTGTQDKNPEDLAKQMEMFSDPLLGNWDPEDVLWEIAIKEGLSLTSRIEKAEGVKGNTVWRISDDDKGQSLLVCLDDKIEPKAVRSLKLTRDTRFICRDVALTDELVANLALQCRLKTI